jgi:oligosaccharide repeat unit polymerase
MATSVYLLPHSKGLTRGVAFGLVLFTCVGALVLGLWDASVSTPWWVEYATAILPLVGALALVRCVYPSNAAYLFSAGFWLSTTVLFYVLLKSVDLIVQDEDLDRLNSTIWAVSLFMFPSVLGYRWANGHIAKKAVAALPKPDVFLTPQSRVWLLAVFVAFKVFGMALVLSASGNVLEVAAATQNNGAAYLYKIPLAANAIFLLIMFDSFRNRRGWGITALAAGIFLVEAVISTSRLSIVMAVLWAAFLYHRYYKPIKISTVALIGAPLVIVIALFGYARNIEVGSWEAYLEAFSVLSANPALLSDLFLARLDMLPEMTRGLTLYENGNLPSLAGGSYIYMFLHAVPRNIWESKPLLTAALLTSITHPGAFEDGVNIFPSIVIEALINFGWPGILLIGAVVGALCARYENALYSDRAIPTTWALTFFTFPMGLFNEGFHSNFTGNLLYTTAVIFLLLKSLVWFKVLKIERTV